MKKAWIFFMAAAIGIAALIVFLREDIFKSKTADRSKKKKIAVAASFYPLYFFAREIGKEKTETVNLTPSGVEPHEWEPNARDIASIEKINLLIANGAGFEPWLDKMTENLAEKNVRTVKVAEGLTIQSDPHIWLDPLLAKQQVVKITQALTDVDSLNSAFYRANGKKLEEKLGQLNEMFKTGLKNCSKKTIVTSHDAFGYVARRYGLKQLAIAGLSPDQEPTPQELAQTVQFAKTHGVKYIFFETLVSPRLAETIAKEIGAQTLVFDPIEGLIRQDQSAGHDYFSVQQENLNHLQIALECD